MIVTIDGPAGAGKSSVSKILAARLGFQFLDTGAMYRAVTWAVMHESVSMDDPEQLAEVASRIQIAFVEKQVLVDGQNVTQAIRTAEVTRNVAAIADAPQVRSHLVRIQREIAKCGNFVCEGRDQGTVVFPHAICKFYLTASAEERAKRRVEELTANGVAANFDDIVDDQNQRDQRDYDRPVGSLKKADDAIEINSDFKTLEEVADQLQLMVLERMQAERLKRADV